MSNFPLDLVTLPSETTTPKRMGGLRTEIGGREEQPPKRVRKCSQADGEEAPQTPVAKPKRWHSRNTEDEEPKRRPKRVRTAKKGSGRVHEEEEAAPQNTFVNSISPKDAPIPAPNLNAFMPAISTKKAAGRSTAKMERTVENDGQRSAKIWATFAPTFRVQDFRLSQIENRPKNAKEDIATAEATIQEMKDLKADACSACFVDEDGKTLVCVFAHRPPDKTPEEGPAEDMTDASSETTEDSSSEDMVDAAPEEKSSKALIYPGSENCTLEDVQGVIGKHWDGIPTKVLERYHEASQVLLHILRPCTNKCDIRHPDEAVMSYNYEQDESEYVREGVNDEKQVGAERTGVIHLVHTWHQQGHPNEPMTHSKDMGGKGTCKGQMAVRKYYETTRPLALYLASCFQSAFPEHYYKYEAAFKAGRWITEDPGPWLGRAIVWKLQVKPHMDGLDEGPTAIFNMGSYIGGELYLPDIRVKLQYEPGSLVIFLSGRLYHSIGEWKAGNFTEGDKLTPGRVGNVFFFPKASFDKLEGKPSEWNWKTSTGTTPTID